MGYGKSQYICSKLSKTSVIKLYYSLKNYSSNAYYQQI